jgi:hypothetical protein
MKGDVETPPPAQPQVVYVVQPAGQPVAQKRSLKEDYATKAATVLGSLHLLFGWITFTTSIYGIVYGNMLSMGMLPSVFFIISGGLAIGGAQAGSRCLVVATLVMAIISAVIAGILIINSSMMMVIMTNTGYHHFETSMFVLEMVMGLAMLMAGITTAALTCRPLCCRRAGAGAVHYTAGCSGVKMPR